QDVSRVFFCIPGMDHERQSRLPRCLDMRLEALALCATVGFVVIIIEAALADRNHAEMVRSFDERRCPKIGVSICFVRMNAYARPDVRMALRHANDVTPFLPPCRDIEETTNAFFTRIFKDFVLALDEAFIIEVAMAVDQPHAAASSSSASSSLGNK